MHKCIFLIQLDHFHEGSVRMLEDDLYNSSSIDSHRTFVDRHLLETSLVQTFADVTLNILYGVTKHFRDRLAT
jgi:hypothetical protein